MTGEDIVASRAWNLLQNGSGAIDWAGLEIVVALLDVQDVEAFVERLEAIKGWEPPKRPRNKTEG